MVIDKLNEIRKLAVISLFYDDDLLSKFVLKGGNALNIIYGLNNRASMDIDVSMEHDFTDQEIEDVRLRLEHSFQEIFKGEKYHVFDLKLFPTPRKVREGLEHFWGGYTLEFKVIEKSKYDNLNGDIDDIRRQSIVVGENQQKTFTIDISKYEYCSPKELVDLDGYSIYVYTPVMVIYEKLRAICQQMDEYKRIVPTNQRPRARDFFDIHSILEGWATPIDLYSPHNIQMLEQIFEVKKVPLSFMGNIINQREFHRDSFNAVRDTVTVERLESFDYYFDYVIGIINPLEYLWKLKEKSEIAATKEE
jgi:predicted nucleotidyltransferase component of viral defense system